METMLIRLNDNNEGILSIDLKEILDTIKPIHELYSWYVYFVDFEQISKNFDQVFPLLKSVNENKGKTPISWEELYLIAESLKQTIDIDFVGEHIGDRIFIRAVDSSFWEIETSNEKLLEYISLKFNDVQIILPR